MEPVQNTSNSMSRCQKMKKNSIKGAVIGGVTTSALGLAVTGPSAYAISHIKSFDTAEKKDYLYFLDEFFESKFPKLYKIHKEKIKLSYSKCIKMALKVLKNPVTWIGVAGAGAVIGGIIGLLCSLGKSSPNNQ